MVSLVGRYHITHGQIYLISKKLCASGSKLPHNTSSIGKGVTAARIPFVSLTRQLADRQFTATATLARYFIGE